jgi:cyclopropane fatty-acyl-phospholipid synthase-like methyltransferase
MGWFARRLFFEVAYRVGLTPWDHADPPPELVEVIEGDRKLSPGRALDLGCGTGNSSIYMAEHGWAVTGVDFAGFAVNRARRKARARGLDIDLRRADVTQLAGAGVDGPFDLVFDLGCFHGLDAEARGRYALEAARVSGDGATYLLFAFSDAPFGRRGPQAVPREAVERQFDPAFEPIAALPGTGPGAPYWYTMRRRR